MILSIAASTEKSEVPRKLPKQWQSAEATGIRRV